MIRVQPLENGTVIDHLPVNTGFKVLRALGGLDEYTFVLASNVHSDKSGSKDMLKISGKELVEKEYNLISLLAPDATINIIKKGKVVRKEKVKIPDEIPDLLDCNNPKCITKTEAFYMVPRFTVLSKNPLVLQCQYCENTLDEEKALKKIRNRD